ncbi:MAG: S9 family peptidase, partial [Chitinophagaceae bacterium]
MKNLSFLFFLFAATANAQDLAPLTVQKIMRDPKWMGTSPDNYRWSADSKTIYFDWNPEVKDKSQPYKVSISSQKTMKADSAEIEDGTVINYVYNKDKSLGLLEKGGDVYLTNIKAKKETRLTNTLERESNARFLYNNDVVYQRADNVYRLNLATGELTQLTNFVKGKAEMSIPAGRNNARSSGASQQDMWLKNDQTALFDIVKKRNAETGNRAGGRGRGFGMSGDNTKPRIIKAIQVGDDFMAGLTVSPDGKYVSYRLIKQAVGNKNTIVPNYVTASGYTEDINGRTKVGEALSTST